MPETRGLTLTQLNEIFGGKISYGKSNMYDIDTEINVLTWYFSTDDKRDFDQRQFSMRMYFPSKINQMLTDAGFKICHQWGDYYRTVLNEGSKLQIYDLQVVS